jgi:arsenite methyltransferase
MAELETTSSTPSPASSCCSPAAQASCCEPEDEAQCCDDRQDDASCGCAVGVAAMDELEHKRETVRQKYARAAEAAVHGEYKQARAIESDSGCCESDRFSCCSPADRTGVFGSALYDEARAEQIPDDAVMASLGCGVPTAVADLSDGETVLDLGSGAGADVLISARRVAPTGKAIGLDMTVEMLELARANAANAGVRNVEFVEGYLEDIPLGDATVDVVISNCVINLSGDKPKVIAEAARVLRPGGRFAVSDVIADPDMDAAARADMSAWTGCIAGALTETEFRSALTAAGLEDIEISETHRVHEHAAAAIIRARKPRV